MNRVAINVDEVLVEFLKPMAQHNKLKLPSKPRYSYVYRNIFDLSQEESTKMVRDFYTTHIPLITYNPYTGLVQSSR
jgi:hypothetical protein